MPNYNHVTLVGHLVRDPEVKYIGNGKTAICQTAIAVSERWKNKQTGETQEKCSFIDIKLFGPNGERFAEWYKKGSCVLIEGKLEQESWEDKQSGQKRSKLVVNVSHHENLSGRREQEPAGVGAGSSGDEDVPF